MTTTPLDSGIPSSVADTIKTDPRPWWNEPILQHFADRNYTPERTARRLGCTPETVREHAARNDVHFTELSENDPYVGGRAAAVYALYLSGDNYYVGMSRQIEQRLHQHFTDNGSNWTQKHPPKRIHSIERHTTPREPREEKRILRERETELTLELMREHGWQHVRGADWAAVDLHHPPRPLWTERDDWPKRNWCTNAEERRWFNSTDKSNNEQMCALMNIADDL